VLVPTFSWSVATPPPPALRPRRNGFDYTRVQPPRGGAEKVYTAGSQEIDPYLGAFPGAVLRRAERVRGNHPLNSFTALGPMADRLIEGQAPLDVHSPLEALAASGGVVLLIGVGLDTMTLLHLAERKAGRTLFRRWAKGLDGSPMMVEVGGCSRGFPRLWPSLASLETRLYVGASSWRIFPAAETLQAAAEAIRETPSITSCNDPRCERCADAVAGGPIL
jgi:hypothetical protein